MDALTFTRDLLDGKELECPCCGRFAKLYKRGITSTMARFLIWIDKESGAGRPWISPADKHKELAAANVLVSGGDHAKLRYWGLLEEMPLEGEDGAKKSSGYWRITERGREFVNDKLEVPQYAHLLFGKVVDFSESTTHISKALGKHFNYRELMDR
jgi:hypothetical protein